MRLTSISLRLEYQPEYLLPHDSFKQLLEDYFTYIYPLVPLIHEASFWDDFRKERHRHDAAYLSLMFAMCACMVSSFPRRVQAYCFQYYESAGAMMERAYTLSLATRPLNYRDNLTCEIVGCMYLLSLAAAYADRHPRTEVALHEMLYCVKTFNVWSQQPSFDND